MFSGISSLTGTLRYFPVRVFWSNSSQEYLGADATLAVITSRLFDLSLTAIVEPGLTRAEGMLQTSPSRVMWQCVTSWRAAALVGAIPRR